MRKKILLSIAMLLCAVTSALAQTGYGRVKTTITDADTGLAVAGAVVELTPTATPDKKLYYSTDGTGSLSILQLKHGDYTLGITFLGYDNVVLPFKLAGSELTLPAVKMSPSSTQIAAVVKEIKALRASQSGDTLNYNASAFKVAADADVEGLLQKMPGISIEDGELSAQGETITKIYVDGKEFFGDDVATALKSLPAEIVDKIEVYDKLSDNAEMTGVDDGTGGKTINIVTHKHMRQGAFGKVFGGLGYEPEPAAGSDRNKYLLGGNVNLFNNDTRVSVIGLSNNINQQNFSFEDILGVSEDSDSQSSAGSYMVKQLPGVAKVNAVGINYSDNLGKKDQLKLQASFFFNHTRTTNDQTKELWYTEPATVDTVYSRTLNYTENVNYRFNSRIDWKINKNHSILIRPNFSYQRNDPFNTSADRENGYYGERWGESTEGRVDIYGDPFIRDIGGVWDGYWSGYNASISANYRYKLNERGTLITLNGNYSVNEYENTNYNRYYNVSSATNEDGETYYYNDPVYEYKTAPSSRTAWGAGFNYVEPLGKGYSFTLNYDIKYNEQNNVSEVYDTDDDLADDFIYDPEVNKREESSSETNSAYTTHRVGPTLKYNKGKTNLVLGASYQHANLTTVVDKARVISWNPKETEPVHDETDSYFNNFTYNAVANVMINKENSLRFYFNSYTSNPPIWKMQEILSTGQYMSIGNSQLVPSYTNQFKARYVNSDLENGRTFMVLLWARNTSNYYANQIKYFSEDETVTVFDTAYSDKLQYTRPTNVDGYWNIFTKVNYGLPINPIKCNLNFNVGITYTIVPSVIGGEVNNDGTMTEGEYSTINNMGYRGGLVLGSNISQNVDFTLSWNGEYNEATESSSAGQEKNRYFNHKANASIKVVFLDGFTFNASAGYTQYMGFTDVYNDDYILCNAFLGRKVFKNRRGEVCVGVYDIFNQNTSFKRYVGTNYTQNLTNSVIGRYATVQFIYNLRAFGKNASKDMKDYQMNKGDGDRHHH
ncbi:MAG: outer membrane beta-barrel protein [Rikenellaceae bacterium]